MAQCDCCQATFPLSLRSAQRLAFSGAAESCLTIWICSGYTNYQPDCLRLRQKGHLTKNRERAKRREGIYSVYCSNSIIHIFVKINSLWKTSTNPLSIHKTWDIRSWSIHCKLLNIYNAREKKTHPKS